VAAHVFYQINVGKTFDTRGRHSYIKSGDQPGRRFSNRKDLKGRGEKTGDVPPHQG